MAQQASTKSSTTRTAVTKSPFFHPSNHGRYVVVQKRSVVRTPGGSKRLVTTTSSQQQPEVHEHKSSVLGCAANLINAIVGAGIVGMPYALKNAGLVAGWILIVLSAAMTERSLRLLIATAKHVHVPSYERVAEAAFGLIGFRFVAANMFLLSYGAMLSYLMLVKDAFSNLLNVDPSDEGLRQIVLLVVSLAIIVPISSQRDMADLAWTSRLSVLIDTVIVGIVVYSSPVRESLLEQDRLADSPETASPWMGLLHLMRTDAIHPETIFVGLGVISFAFVCQHSAFIIAGSLERPTVARWSMVSGLALSFCTLLASLCALMGYVGYLQDTNGNILTNLDPDSPVARAGRSMLGLTMLFVYPMESFVARHVCVVLLFSGRRAHEGDDSSILNRADRRIGLTILLYILAVTPAALSEDLGSVLALTGAVGGSCLSYIGPGFVYLGVHGERFLQLAQQSSWFSTQLPCEQVSASQSVHATTQLLVYGSKPSTGDNDDNTSDAAVESSPLVCVPEDAVDNKILESPQTDKEMIRLQAPSTDSSTLLKCWQAILWYATGMPIWCLIAANGEKGLQRHMQDMALKSPFPIRIGDVEYQRVAVERVTAKAERPSSRAAHNWDDDGSQSEDDESCAERGNRSLSSVVPSIVPFHTAKSADNDIHSQGRYKDSNTTKPALLMHHYSFGTSSYQASPLPHTPVPPSSDHGSTNQRIAQDILRRNIEQHDQGQQKQPQSSPLEPDPQLAPPQWSDFIIAIFYILFGLVALFAGLFSLLRDRATKVST